MAERHILLVDDEPNLQESMKIGLELRGYDVSVASNASMVGTGKELIARAIHDNSPRA
jgi:DNA-binding NtrC family response regulator